jgi:hypothetical protein
MSINFLLKASLIFAGIVVSFSQYKSAGNLEYFVVISFERDQVLQYFNNN